jgi:hypothetical protein
MLRTVVLLADLKPLMSEEALEYVGQSFPELRQNSSPCTVIEIVADEDEGNSRVGFYLIEKTPLHFEDSLRAFRKAASGSI